jgi:hypothetical protein
MLNIIKNIQNKVDHLPLLFLLPITVLHDTNESTDPPAQPTISYQNGSNIQQTPWAHQYP